MQVTIIKLVKYSATQYYYIFEGKINNYYNCIVPRFLNCFAYMIKLLEIYGPVVHKLCTTVPWMPRKIIQLVHLTHSVHHYQGQLPL